MPPLKPSTAADIGRIAPALFTLPFPHNGKTLVFALRALNMDQFSKAQAGPPTMAPDPDGTRRLTPYEAHDAASQLREVARAGVVEPAGLMDGDDPAWDHLSSGNQGAVIQEIYRLSGIGQSPDGEAAKRAVGFPAEPGGANHGTAAAPAVRAGAAAP